MDRYVKNIIARHLKNDRQMVFLAGPRQVGKTYFSKNYLTDLGDVKYYNWDNLSDRNLMLSGPDKLALDAGFSVLSDSRKILILDEIHKFSDWKNYLKGFFDTYGDEVAIVVTGSAKLDVYKKGGDSLMGRYFSYRLHPVSLREALCSLPSTCENEISSPIRCGHELMNALLEYGGFPEPFHKSDKRFFNRWSNLRFQQLFRDDIRDFANIREIGQLELLAELIRLDVGQLFSYSSLAKKCCVSIDTIKRWLAILESVYYCFRISPWSKNISRSLLKEPKFYLWDWSAVGDLGSKMENFAASHLLKAINYWEDAGLNRYSLHFLRDKEKKECDFLITKDEVPWILLEIKKSSHKSISPALAHFQKQLHAKHVFQIAFDMDYVDKDCFELEKPMIVPALTFFSQLV